MCYQYELCRWKKEISYRAFSFLEKGNSRNVQGRKGNGIVMLMKIFCYIIEEIHSMVRHSLWHRKQEMSIVGQRQWCVQLTTIESKNQSVTPNKCW